MSSSAGHAIVHESTTELICEQFTTVTVPGHTTLPYTTVSTGDVVLQLASAVPTSLSGQPGVQCSMGAVAIGFSLEPSFVFTQVISPLPQATASSTLSSPVSEGDLSSSSTSSQNKKIIGPVLGAVLGAILLASLFGWIFVLRRRRRAKAETRNEWSRAPGKWNFSSRSHRRPIRLDSISVPRSSA